MTLLEATTLIGIKMRLWLVAYLSSCFVGFAKKPLLKADFFDERVRHLVAEKLDDAYYLLMKKLPSELVKLVFSYLKKY